MNYIRGRLIIRAENVKIARCDSIPYHLHNLIGKQGTRFMRGNPRHCPTGDQKMRGNRCALSPAKIMHLRFGVGLHG